MAAVLVKEYVPYVSCINGSGNMMVVTFAKNTITYACHFSSELVLAYVTMSVSVTLLSPGS